MCCKTPKLFAMEKNKSLCYFKPNNSNPKLFSPTTLHILQCCLATLAIERISFREVYLRCNLTQWCFQRGKVIFFLFNTFFFSPFLWYDVNVISIVFCCIQIFTFTPIWSSYHIVVIINNHHLLIVILCFMFYGTKCTQLQDLH